MYPGPVAAKAQITPTAVLDSCYKMFALVFFGLLQLLESEIELLDFSLVFIFFRWASSPKGKLAHLKN